MIRANLADGRTKAFDLDTEAGREAWQEIEGDRDRQHDLRGVIVVESEIAVAVPAPKGFRECLTRVEVDRSDAGEKRATRLVVQADDVRIAVTVYPSGIGRVDVRRTGKPRHLTAFGR